MLKKLVNECHFRVQITTQGPLLVKSGHATSHGADMTPVLTYRNNQEQVFIPGSSIKGVFRSHIEKVMRSFNETAVCALDEIKKENITVKKGQVDYPKYPHVSCGEKFEIRRIKEPSAKIEDKDGKKWAVSNPDIRLEPSFNPVIYRDSCPACRLFGSTFFAGRVYTNDAYLTGNPGIKLYTEPRDCVGIDRFSGGAADRAKFKIDVVSAGVTFETDMYLKNFEIWQLGAMMVILQDLEDEIIRVGSGKSRGLGKIKGAADQITIQYIESNLNGKQPNQVWGLGKFLQPDEYGTFSDDTLTLEKPPEETRNGIRRVQNYQNESLNELKTKSIEHFVQRIQAWQVEKTMKVDHLQVKEA
jgi:CRISPR-associated RAMP protein (TIGR02581 family)